MDEVLRKRGLWVGLGVMGLVFLCLMACAFGAFLSLMPRQTVTYAPVPYAAPQSGEEGAAPQLYQGPAVARYGGYGPLGIVGSGFRLLFRVIFFGLLLMLGLRLLRHLVWGPRRWYAPYWGPPYHGKPPSGAAQGEQGEAGWGWGPPPWARRACRHHRHHWGPPPWWGPAEAGEKGAGQAAGEPAADQPDEYSGPQE